MGGAAHTHVAAPRLAFEPQVCVYTHLPCTCATGAALWVLSVQDGIRKTQFVPMQAGICHPLRAGDHSVSHTLYPCTASDSASSCIVHIARRLTRMCISLIIQTQRSLAAVLPSCLRPPLRNNLAPVVCALGPTSRVQADISHSHGRWVPQTGPHTLTSL